MFDGATGIGPALRLAGGDDPPEWDGIGGPNWYHDRAYYEHRPNDRAEVDRNWFNLMMLAADALEGSNPDRADLLRRKAKLRYAVVRAVGWYWWMRH
mgnify:CR=1 FL=1